MKRDRAAISSFLLVMAACNVTRAYQGDPLPREKTALPAPTPPETSVGSPVLLGDTGLSMVLPNGCEPLPVEEVKLMQVRFFAIHRSGVKANVMVTDYGKAVGSVDIAAMRAELYDLLGDFEMRADGKRTVLGMDSYWVHGIAYPSSFGPLPGRGMYDSWVLVPTTPAFWICFQTTEDKFDAVAPEFEAALATLTADPALLAR